MKTINFFKITILFSLLLSSFSGFSQYTSIPDSNFEQALINLGIDSGVIDGQVLTTSINSVKSLEIRYQNISNLSGIEGFSELETLICNNNNLTALDFSKNSKLNYLDCSGNKLTSLNVSENYNLNLLNCNQNNLSAIDIAKNLALKSLGCSYNQLKTLNVSKNTALEIFYCTFNQITSLDTSNNTNLNIFVCYNNQLTDLDISKNLNLNMFSCSNNHITTLDISKNTGINSFSCDNNNLSSLSVKNGINNYMLAIDLTSNPNLSCIEVDNANYSNINWSTYKDASATYSNNCNKATVTTAPIIKATGNQLYCPLTAINIVTSFTISHDPAELGTKAVYIQISSGYSSGLDKIEIQNPAAHPSIVQGWYPNEGKLVLSSPTGGDVLYSDLEAAIKDVVFSNSSPTASGTRTFSITVGQANYLPSTGHYYLYVPSIGISWTAAKAAAETSSYYGLKGYLATLLSADEAKLSGEQASGTGWIGGSDQETEGTWKWVTGPEAGTVMSYAFWNNGEPNNLGDEDYAHITQPGVGIKGSWNDLSNSGDVSGNYQPKGYVVEYGGSAGELPLEIAASTKITIPVATPDPNPAPMCDSGSFNFTATATTGATISWYDQATGGTAIHTGPSFVTPPISTTTTYYVDAGCDSNRKSVTATINHTPTAPIAVKSTYSNCGPGPVTIEASANIGEINWFQEAIGGTSLHSGQSYTPTVSSNTTYYAEASNGLCAYDTRTPVNIEIHALPVVTNETLPLCQGQTIILDAGIAGMTYLWSTGEASQTIPVDKGGTYTVVVTNPQNCSSTKTITVNENLVPQINHIDVNGTTVTIKLVKEEDYFEYSVDGSNFQASNVFYDVPGGLHNAYVRDKTGCPGGNPKSFVVLVFPAYFTPNNDTFHDVWEVTGIENYPQAQVTIFDRYGKLLAQLTASKMSWDGTFNEVALPASDYWYALKIDDTQPVLRGHFSLKR
ncbi:T9SS type B sorting domain-containing protein [Flavobacterium sp. LAR06]|uniref:Ig-like domain-containing protein n=1 Tax=Flavobacterium sp. LAR06 TaxID=3064897 RepID=UPI0035C04A13